MNYKLLETEKYKKFVLLHNASKWRRRKVPVLPTEGKKKNYIDISNAIKKNKAFVSYASLNFFLFFWLIHDNYNGKEQ